MSAITPSISDPRTPLKIGNGSAVFLVALAGIMLANLAPLVMAALGDLGFDTLVSGNLLTLALLASSIVGLSTTALAAGAARRRLAGIGLALAIVAFTIAALFSSPLVVATALVVGGAGVGAAISTSGASLAALLNPNRVSALSGLVNRVLIALLLAVIPIFGVGRVSVFGALALTSLIAFFLSARLPQTPRCDAQAVSDERQTKTPSAHVTVAGVVLLIILPLWGASEDAIWTMAATLGDSAGLDQDIISLILSLATAVGILGVLLVIVFGDRLGRAVPITVALLLGGGLKIWIGITDSGPLFIVLIVGINAVYAFALILFIATSAALDLSGRWSAPIGGAYLIGSSFAPSVGSALIEWFGIPTFTLITGLVSFAAIIPAMLIARVSVRQERALSASHSAH